MKQIVFLCTFLMLAATSFAQWMLDKGHSKVAFIRLSEKNPIPLGQGVQKPTFYCNHF
jgi:hypothetical protein